MAKKTKKSISVDVKIANFATSFDESDKGCVLLIGSMLENALGHLHETSILANVGTTDIFKKLKDNRGPLSDFYSRINLAFAFRLISKDLFEALHIFRKLRNEAAHCDFNFSLRDPGVRKHLEQLEKYYKELNEDDVLQFEEILAKVEVENIMKFAFLVRCHHILKELLGHVLEQLNRDFKGSKGRSEFNAEKQKDKNRQKLVKN